MAVRGYRSRLPAGRLRAGVSLGSGVGLPARAPARQHRRERAEPLDGGRPLPPRGIPRRCAGHGRHNLRVVPERSRSSSRKGSAQRGKSNKRTFWWSRKPAIAPGWQMSGKVPVTTTRSKHESVLLILPWWRSTNGFIAGASIARDLPVTIDDQACLVPAMPGWALPATFIKVDPEKTVVLSPVPALSSVSLIVDIKRYTSDGELIIEALTA